MFLIWINRFCCTVYIAVHLSGMDTAFKHGAPQDVPVNLYEKMQQLEESGSEAHIHIREPMYFFVNCLNANLSPIVN